jgi:serine phosphatase RsbU (regulator of sigma subunit)/CHASE2 domain-containing sensor protein
VWWGLSELRGSGRTVALAVVAAGILLRSVDPGGVAELRLRGFDLLQILWPRTPDPPDVAVVAIDEKSLARYGQWPWPRSRLAELVRRIAKGRALVLGIDIIFAEADRLSPAAIARELPDLPPAAAEALRAMPSSDRELADAMRALPTVLALVPGSETLPSAGPVRQSPILQSGGDARRFLANSSPLRRLVPEIAAAAKGSASIEFLPDADGIVRRIPLALTHQGGILPGFALEVLRIATGGGPVVIDTGAHGIDDVRVAGRAVPTDPHGNALVHFAPQLAQDISTADLLDPSFNAAELRNKAVLLGVTGLGIVDLRETPLGLVQGIDIHAQLIRSMVLGTLLHRPASLFWIELGAAFVAGLAAIALPRYARPAEAVGLILALIALPLAAEAALFRWAAVLFDGTYPALTALAAFAVMVVGSLRAAQAALRHERDLKQRMAGELAAAQAIQMGLLPRRYPAFPDHPELDLCARIEPARMVGGDFYDYLLIDRDRRLFFLIADVSDKGIPAALFMAMTKEVVRDAVLRFGSALDCILAEVNRKTAAASAELPSQGGDMMFVTAFAGILDLDSGEVAYASAGHDSPFVLGGGSGVRQLATEGGPPLGVIDPFPFPIDHDRILPGEILLLFTDGVTEAQNAERTLYSAERLTALLKTAPATDAGRVVAAVIADLRHFVGGAEQADDITLLAVRRAI